MQIYEVRKDFADILYASEEESLNLSDFLFLEDNQQTVISQVTDIKEMEDSEINVATVKFYLSVNKDNKLSPYDGHIPANDSDIGRLDSQEILGLFRPKSRELSWGNYIGNPQIHISTDMKFLSSNACILCDKAESSQKLVQNILNSLNSNDVKSMIFDFDGKYSLTKVQKKLRYGRDIRIPLDINALDYIFNNELEELPFITKTIVQNIILETEKFLETIPNGFIPFDTFSQIVESECRSSNDAGLLIFSNKLAQFRQKKIFANDPSQFEILNTLKNSSIIDISEADVHFHKLIFDSLINRISEKYYIFADITEDNIDNNSIKRIYENSNIRLVSICKHDEKYLPRIKQFCNNYVLFHSEQEINLDDSLRNFVSKLSENDFILYGESTLSIPIMVTMNKSSLDIEDDENSNFQEDIITTQDLDDLDLLNLREVNKKLEMEQKAETAVSDTTQIETPEIEAQEKPIENNAETIARQNILENLFQNRNTGINLNSNVKKEETVSYQNDANVQPNDQEEFIQEQVEEDDDYDYLEEQDNPSETQVNQTVNYEENNSVLPNSVLEKNYSEPLPVYTPKEPVLQREPVVFEAGNRVSHAKYGVGIVEKIMSYGKKTLCCIQFDNVGRKLLDPSVTLIEKIV